MPWTLLLLSLAPISVCTVSMATVSNTTATAIFAGDVYAALFIDIHHAVETNGPKSRHPFVEVKPEVICSKVNPGGVQQLWAALWALRVINRQIEPNMPKLGLYIYDTCDSSELATHHALSFLRDTIPGMMASGCGAECSGNRSELHSPVAMLGAMGAGRASTLATLRGLLHTYSVPFLLTTPNSMSVARDDVLVTAPTVSALVQATVSLLDKVQLKSVHFVTSNLEAYERFMTSCPDSDITVQRSWVVPSVGDDWHWLDSICTLSSQSLMTTVVVAILLEPGQVEHVARAASNKSSNLTRVTWVWVSPSLDPESLPAWFLSSQVAFVVVPHTLHIADFDDFFVDALARVRNMAHTHTDTHNHPHKHDPSDDPDLFVGAFLRQQFGCSTLNDTGDTGNRPCSSVGVSELRATFRQDANVGYVSKATSALAAAFRILQIDRCRVGVDCVRHLQAPLFGDIANALAKLSFQLDSHAPTELEGTRLKFTEDGHLLFSHFDLFAANPDGVVEKVGWYSGNLGVQLNTFGRWRQLLDTSKINEQNQWAKFQRQETKPTSVAHSDFPATNGEVFRFARTSQGIYMDRVWTSIILIMVGTGLVVSVCILVYILHKVCDRTLRGNQFLTVALLLGVMLEFASCFPFILQPGEIVCNWRLFLPSFSHVLTFSSLLVEIMHLRSLVTLGLGGQVSYVNQAITVMFAVVVQVAINLEWSLLARPMAARNFDGGKRCTTDGNQFLALQTYVVVVLLSVLIYSAVLNREDRVRRGIVPQGRRVFYTSVLSFIIWVAWVAVFVSTEELFQEVSVCFELLASAFSVLGCVFAPQIQDLRRKKRPSALTGTTAISNTIFSLGLDGLGSTASPVGGGGGPCTWKGYRSNMKEKRAMPYENN